MLFYWKASDAMSLRRFQSNSTREEGNSKDFNVNSTECNVILMGSKGNNGIDNHSSNSYSIKCNRMLVQLRETMVMVGNQRDINREEGNQ